MSIDVHPGLRQAAAHDVSLVHDEYDDDASWAETTITVLAATIAVVFVSFVAALMAMA